MSLLDAVKYARGETITGPATIPSEGGGTGSLLDAVKYARGEVSAPTTPAPSTQPNLFQKVISGIGNLFTSNFYSDFPSLFGSPIIPKAIIPSFAGIKLKALEKVDTQQKEILDKFWSNPVDNTIKITQDALVKHPKVLEALADVQNFVENFQYTDPITKNIIPVGIAKNPLNYGIVKGTANAFLGSSVRVNEAFNTRLVTPVSPKGFEGAYKTYDTVGQVIGQVMAYEAGGSTLKAAKFGQATLPVLFATIGQTSAGPDTTTAQRIAKLPIDLISGYLFSMVPQFKPTGLSPENIKTLFKGTGMIGGTGAVQGFLDALIVGKKPEEAAKLAAKQAVILSLFHIVGSSLRLFNDEIMNVQSRTATLGTFTQDQLRTMANDPTIKNKTFRDNLIGIADELEASGKTAAVIDMTMFKKGWLGEKVNPIKIDISGEVPITDQFGNLANKTATVTIKGVPVKTYTTMEYALIDELPATTQPISVKPPETITKGFNEDIVLRKTMAKEGYGLWSVFENKDIALQEAQNKFGSDFKFIQHISTEETGQKPTFEIYGKGVVDQFTKQPKVAQPPVQPIEAAGQPGVKTPEVSQIKTYTYGEVKEIIKVEPKDVETGGKVAEAYSADTIADESRVKAPVEFNGKKYTVISGGAGGYEGYQLVPKSEYKGKTSPYNTHAEVVGREAGYEGMEVKYRNEEYVMTNKTVFTTTEQPLTTIPKELKPSKDKFYILEQSSEGGQKKFTEVKGEPVDIMKGVDTFVRKGNGGGWVVTETKTGLAVSAEASSRQKAISEAEKNLREREADLGKLIEKSIRENGLSPRYGGTTEAKKPVKPTPKPVKPAPKAVLKNVEKEKIKSLVTDTWKSAKSQEEAIQKLNSLVKTALKAPKNETTTKKLTILKASIRNQMYNVAGIGQTGKESLTQKRRDYGQLQTLKENPEVSGLIRRMETAVVELEEAINPVPTGFGDVGGYSDIKSINKQISELKVVELPELVSIAKKLTGQPPVIKKRLGRALGKFYGVEGTDGRIALLDNIFKNPELAAKVLAHEIGHAHDFLPDKTMAHGNLVGRIANLNRFMQDKFGDLSNKELRAELEKLSQAWKPIEENASESYIKYRNSSKELYADAISVLYNDPALLKQEAPTFYQALFDYFDEKPDVKATYLSIQDIINKGTEFVLSNREETIKEGFGKAEEVWKQKRTERELAKVSLWERLRQLVDDRNYPILRRIKELEAKGIEVPPETNPKFILQELSFADNDNYLMVADMDEKVIKPLTEKDISTDDLGEYLLLNRIVTERQTIANPYGHTKETALTQLDFMKHRLKDRFPVLEESAKKFHDIVFKSVERAVEVGTYNEKVFKGKIEPNKENYAAFGVLDYIQDYVPAGIKSQIGTFKGVANPFLTTVLKTISLNRLNSRQDALNSWRDTWKEHFTDEIKPSRVIRSGKMKIFVDTAGWGRVEMLEDGKYVSYDTDPYVARSFARNKIGDIQLGAILNKAFLNGMFRDLYITYNPGFALAFNPIRDFKRTYKSLNALGYKVSLVDLIRSYIETLPDSIRRERGITDELVNQMLKDKAIQIRFNDYNFDPRDDEFGQILARYGLVNLKQTKIGTLKKSVLKPVISVLEGVRFVGSIIENLAKIAGYNTLVKKGVYGKRLGYTTRTYVGTPNWRTGGEITQTTNAIFMFSNIFLQGYKADLGLATGPKTRGGYWWSSIKLDLLPKFLMFLAQTGLFGIVLKKFYDKVSEYDKTNYLIIPLGMTKKGKAVYLRIPHDETGRLIAGMFWKVATSIYEKKLKNLSEMFAFGAGQIPNVAPAITLAEGWMQFLGGKNPYDSYRGRYIIPDTEWKAGGWPALKNMVEWTVNQFGLSSFTTYDPSNKTTFEAILQVLPVFNRLIKISDYGQIEKNREISQGIVQKNAKETLRKRDIMDKYIKKYQENPAQKSQLERDLITETLGHYPPRNSDEKQVFTNTLTKFRIGILRGQVDPNLDALIDANTNEEKAIILLNINKNVSQEEFDRILKTARENKIISADALQKYREELVKSGKTSFQPEETKMLGEILQKANFFNPPEVSAIEVPKRVFPYQLEDIGNGKVRIYYPTGGSSDVAEKDVPKYLRLIQGNFDKFGVGKYPDYAPNWLSGPEKKVEMKATPTPFNDAIQKVFGDDWVNATNVLRWLDDKGVVRGENTQFDPSVTVKNKNGSEDRGLFQINSRTFEDFLRRKKDLLAENGIKSWDDMLNPEKNIKMAKIIYDEQGWKAWYGAPPL